MVSFLSLLRRRSPLRSVASLFVFLVPVAPCIVNAAKAESHTGSTSSPDGIAFGFDLGQSYVTSAARFPNGTTLPLVKIPGSPKYISLMEGLVAQPPTPYWLSMHGTLGHILGVFRAVLRIFGVSPTTDARILSEMVLKLKIESESILGMEIRENVAVTAPWVAAWDGQIPVDSAINDALLLAGLEPSGDRVRADVPTYLDEINAAWAGKGRWICPRNWCVGHWMEVDELKEVSEGGEVFVVSFTNRSLYTSFQREACYHFSAWDSHLASIDARYGLDRASQVDSPAQFWGGLRLHLVSLVEKNRARHIARGGRGQRSLVVLIMGEAADTPEFLEVVTGVARDIQQGGGAEVLVLDDTTFGPAKGAAFWLSTRLNATYCNEVYEADGILSQYDMVREQEAGTHGEL